MLLEVSVMLNTQRLLWAYEVDIDRITVNGAGRTPSFEWNILVGGIV